jgi:chromosome partitioning protein
MSMKIISGANQKGGVGKSTLISHLAYRALELGLRVLLVDMDKQGSLSLTFNANNKSGLVASTLFSSDFESEKQSPQQVAENLFIIPADNKLLSIDKAENAVIRNPAKALKKYADDFDVCIIDTPPLLGIRLMASLAASDYVVTPVSIGLYEMAGVEDLIQTIHVVRTQGFNPKLKHIGVLPMKTNNRSTREQAGLQELKDKYGDAILNESLPERAAVRNAVAEKVAVWHKPRGGSHQKAAKEWIAACDAVLARVK